MRDHHSCKITVDVAAGLNLHGLMHADDNGRHRSIESRIQYAHCTAASWKGVRFDVNRIRPKSDFHYRFDPQRESRKEQTYESWDTKRGKDLDMLSHVASDLVRWSFIRGPFSVRQLPSSRRLRCATPPAGADIVRLDLCHRNGDPTLRP